MKQILRYAQNDGRGVQNDERRKQNDEYTTVDAHVVTLLSMTLFNRFGVKLYIIAYIF